MAPVRNLAAWLNGRRAMVLAVLAVFVAIGAAGAGQSARSDAWLGLPSLDFLNYVLVGLMGLGVLLILVSLVGARKQGTGPRPKRRPMWPLLLLFLVFFALSQRPRSDDAAADDAPVAEEQEESDRGIGARAPGRAEIGALLVVLAAAVGVLVLVRRATDPDRIDVFDDDQLAEDLTPAVEAAVDHLALGDDPRSSVLLAYSELESALRGRGVARTPSETPSEHLERVLRNVPIDTDPLVRLAGLYQLARFSNHPITAEDQEQAASELQRVFDQLAALG